MQFVQTRVVLQYPPAGTELNIRYSDGRRAKTSASDADRFVAIDRQSGGYPYSVGIEDAHRFTSVEDAEKYCGAMNREQFKICHLTITYEVE